MVSSSLSNDTHSSARKSWLVINWNSNIQMVRDIYNIKNNVQWNITESQTGLWFHIYIWEPKSLLWKEEGERLSNAFCSGEEVTWKIKKNEFSSKSEWVKNGYQPELAWERASSLLSWHPAFAHITSSSSSWYPGIMPLLSSISSVTLSLTDHIIWHFIFLKLLVDIVFSTTPPRTKPP